MAKRKSESGPSLDELVEQFIGVSAQISPLEKVKKGLSAKIKALLGDKEEYEHPLGTLTFKYDESKEIEVVDMLKLKEKYPKVYDAVVSIETKEGKRSLRMPSANKEEE